MHVTNSACHNICHSCNIDYSNWSDLNVHNVNVHHECTECNERFVNENNLREVPYDPTTLPFGSNTGLTPLEHKRVHLPLKYECLGCDRWFSEFSAMMLHLESGNCESGVDCDDIDDWVIDYWGFKFGDYTNDWTDYYKFCCPSCDNEFRFVSGLLQHIASQACDMDLDEAIEDFNACFAWRFCCL